MVIWLKRFFSDRPGAASMEYGLIAALVAVATIAAVTRNGTTLQHKFN